MKRKFEESSTGDADQADSGPKRSRIQIPDPPKRELRRQKPSLTEKWGDLEEEFEKKDTKLMNRIHDETLARIDLKEVTACPDCKLTGHGFIKSMYSPLTCDNGHYWWPSQNYTINAKRAHHSSLIGYYGRHVMDVISKEQIQAKIELIEEQKRALRRIVKGSSVG